MNYNVGSLTTVADCDALLAMAAKEKENLLYRRLLLEHSQTIYSTTGVELTAELQSVTTDLEPMADKIAGLPEGRDKRDAIAKQKKLEWRQAMLTNKKYDYGSLAQVENQLELFRNQQDIEAMDDFAASITAHKATL